MGKKVIWAWLVIILLTISIYSMACGTETTTPTSSAAASATTSKTTTVSPKTTTPLVLTSTSATASASTAATSTTPAESNWWTSLGKPQYGDEITTAVTSIMPNFDIYSFIGAETNLWYESLFQPDWTLEREKWPMSEMFIPDQYLKGLLVDTWEITDQQTVTVHLKQNIRWQNKAPVNGREFTAYDVQAHYDRILGKGDYTEPAPMYAGMTSNWDKVTATDKYTVVFKFKTPCGGASLQAIGDRLALNNIEAPEWVAQGEVAIDDWKTAVGTGPWMLTDFVDGSAMTFTRNPDYWGNDPRYPENQVPYADSLKILVIPDASSRVSAIRTGQVDIMTSLTWQQVKPMENSDVIVKAGVVGSCTGVVFKVDAKPFNDIKVRKALQMAINRQAIASGVYDGTTDGKPCGLVTQAYKGYAYAYEDWPQELKDEYAYNPEKAKQLLAEAGYPTGFDTNIVTSIVEAGGTTATFGGISSELIETYQSYFKDIGVNMEIKTMDRVQVESYLRSGKHDQMATLAAGLSMPPTFLIDEFYSKSGDIGVTNISDPVYDAARDKFWSAQTPDEAAKALMEADKRVIEQHWGIWMVGSPTYSVYQPYIKGYDGEYLGWGQGMVYSRIWVDKNSGK